MEELVDDIDDNVSRDELIKRTRDTIKDINKINKLIRLADSSEGAGTQSGNMKWEIWPRMRRMIREYGQQNLPPVGENDSASLTENGVEKFHGRKQVQGNIRARP